MILPDDDTCHAYLQGVWFLQSTFVLEVRAVDLNYYLRSFSSC